MTCRCMFLNVWMDICEYACMFSMYRLLLSHLPKPFTHHAMTCSMIAAGGCGFEFCWICLGDYHCHNSDNCSCVHP